jgi:hypothetical protein
MMMMTMMGEYGQEGVGVVLVARDHQFLSVLLSSLCMRLWVWHLLHQRKKLGKLTDAWLSNTTLMLTRR